VKFAPVLLWTAAACAQSLEIYSEFQRVDPFGNIVAIDKAESPREILSPALPRNAWFSYHVSVTVPEGMPAFLYVQQNPEILRVEVYRERFVKTAAGWIPARCRRTSSPTIHLAGCSGRHFGQTTVSFWQANQVPAEVPPGACGAALLKAGDRSWCIPGAAHPAEDRPAFE